MPPVEAFLNKNGRILDVRGERIEMLEHLAVFAARFLVCLFWTMLIGIVVAGVVCTKIDA